MIRSSRARQVILGLTAAVFLGIACGSLLAPHLMARGLGYSLDNVDALSEFRAIYLGLWTATAALLVFALLRIAQPVFGDLGAMLILGQVLGRGVSLLLDGAPTARIWPMFILEALGGVVLLLVRPSSSDGRRPETKA